MFHTGTSCAATKMMRSSQQLAALLVHQKPGQKRARGKNQYRHRRQVHSFEVKPNEQKNKQILYCSVLLDAIWNKYQNNLCTPWELAHTGHGWHGWNGTHRGFRCVFGVDSAAHVEGILLQLWTKGVGNQYSIFTYTILTKTYRFLLQ